MLLQSSFLLAQAFSKPESLPGHDHPRPMGGADLLDDVQVRLRPLSMLGFHPGPWPMGGADLSDEVAPRRLPMLGSDPGALPELASALEPRPSFDCRPEPDVGEAATFSGQSRAAAAKLASHAMDDRNSNFQRLWSDSRDCSAWLFEQSAQQPLA